MSDECNHHILDMSDIERCTEPPCANCGDPACSHRTLELMNGPHKGSVFHCIVLDADPGHLCACPGYEAATPEPALARGTV